MSIVAYIICLIALLAYITLIIIFFAKKEIRQYKHKNNKTNNKK